jgi:hypothetical protein
MGRRGWLTGLACFLVTLALAYVGWATFRPRVDECYACIRPIHAHSKTVAVVDGHPRLFCCPACALSQHQQMGKPIKITQLTSFSTGKAISTDGAYVVQGSSVNMCETKHELMDADKRSADLLYDRCAPSLIAFGQRNEADQFAREHGGEVKPFTELTAAMTK